MEFFFITVCNKCQTPIIFVFLFLLFPVFFNDYGGTLLCVLLQNYYSVYGGQHFSPYYPSSGASGPAGLIHNIYPFYAQYAQSSQAHGYGAQYPQMVQFPFLPQHYASTGILSFPSSMSIPTTSAGNKFRRSYC